LANLFDQPALPGLWGDAEDYDTRMIVERMRRNQAYENSLFGRIADWLGRQQEWFEGASAFNPIAMALEGAQIANRWAGSPAFPERVQQGDMLAPLGLGAMAAPFAVRGAIGSAGGRLAASASDLPMDEASRLARAREMGFDTDTVLYHGTDETFTEFDPAMSRTARYHFFTPDRETASGYGRNVGEYFVRGGKQANLVDPGPEEIAVLRRTYDAIGDDYGFDSFDDFLDAVTSGQMYQMFASPHFQNDVLGDLRAAGFGSVRMPDAGFGGTMSESVVVFDPKNIRSVNAAFDPSKSDSANLLAADTARSSLPGIVINAAAEPQGIRAYGDPRVVGGTAGRTEMLSEDPSVSRVTAYHGSPNTFTLFDEETVPWFSTSERTAERFGADRASNAYHHNASSLQRLKNAGKLHLYRADIEGRILDNDPMAEAAIIAREIGVEEPKTWDEVAELLQWADYQTQIINDARRQGFDAVRFRNVGDDPVGAISDHIAVLNPQAIKNFTQLYADQSRSYLPGTVINAAAEGSRNDRKWRKATNER